jgi:RES domain-containing protein
VYRSAFADSAFNGDGARLAGGRWNSKGHAVIYTAQSLSLALLEIIVAANRAELASDFVYATVDIPDAVRTEELERRALPRNWFEFPAPAALQRIGDDWLAAGRTVAFGVPSAVTRIEENVLLNPAHTDFKRLRISPAQPIPIDRRLRRTS